MFIYLFATYYITINSSPKHATPSMLIFQIFEDMDHSYPSDVVHYIHAPQDSNLCGIYR